VASTRAIVRDLELFQAIVKRVTNATESVPRVPTTIVLFRDRASYRPYAPVNSEGVFFPGDRANFALVDTSSVLGGLGVLKHEYVHYVMRNGSTVAYPTWYEEGFAELMRSTRIEADDVHIGAPLLDRLPALARSTLSIQTILTAKLDALTAQEAALFSAQSWILVHYLRFGGLLGFRDRSAQLTPYLERVREGMPVAQAAREAFGIHLRGLEQELERYSRQRRLAGLQMPRASFPDPGEPAIRSLAAAEVAQVLGAVALRAGVPDPAERLFRAILAEHPTDARAHFGLARALRAQGRKGNYEALYERGLALEPNTALNQLDYAEYVLATVDVAASVPPEQRRPLLTALRTHLRGAIELDPDLPAAHAQLAKSYLAVPGEDVASGLAAAQRAHELLRSGAEINYLLALGHFRSCQFDEARRFVRIAQAQANGKVAVIERLARQIDDADRTLGSVRDDRR